MPARSKKISAKSSEAPKLIVGLCGGSASGKSWLAKHLAQHLSGRAAVVCQDWYYKDNGGLSDEEAAKLNFDHPDAIESSLLMRQLKDLRAGKTVEAPIYRYDSHSRSKETRTLRPAEVLIVEGLFVLHEKRIRDLLDLSVYLEVPADERLLRRVRRDVEERRVDLEETLRLYERFVRPMHEAFIEPSKAKAQMVWRQLDDKKFPEELLAKIRTRLGQ